ERARLYTESYQETDGQPAAVRAAKALAKTLAEMTIYISQEELIVGNRTSKSMAGVIPVERGDISVVLELEMDSLGKRKRPFIISEADKKALREEILPYWKGKTIRDKKAFLWADRDLMKIRFLGEIDRHCPNIAIDVFDVQGHLVLGHENVMHKGFGGIKEKASGHLRKLQTENPDDEKKADFLRAVIICSQSAIAFAHRFADEAVKLAEREPTPGRRGELLRIAENCRWVPDNPPRTFYEAMQCLWFTQVMAQISYGMAGTFALGRVDQYLYPFYRRDVEERMLTREEAQELLEELQLKLTSNILLLPEAGAEVASTLGTSPQPITIGGQTKDGMDATNELSYMVLEASEKLKAVINNLAIRIHSKTPEDFLVRACQVYRSTSGQAFYNDDVVIPALLSDGYTLEDARDYAIVGCVEPTGSGNTFACTGGNDLRLGSVLEMALSNGDSRLIGRQGLPTGDPAGFKTFDDVMGAFSRQLEHNVEMAVGAVNAKDEVWREEFPTPFVSATLTGCVESGRDATDGGARYNFGSITARGLGTTADSLAAIKRFVFDDQVLTMRELLEMLGANFEGKDSVRQLLVSQAPKYGNDDDYVDVIAKEVAGLFCREVTKHQSVRGGHFRPAFYSYGTHVADGLLLGATPDGRMAGEATSNGVSPANGREQEGPTAVLKSSAKLEHGLMSNGNSLNLRLLPALVHDADAVRKVASLVKTYFDLGGMHLQFNVVSRDTLEDAQKHPQDYRDLVVRVSGYSAFFTDLGKLIQDDIIARTEFGSP
ncbi:MAG: formate C-acetyltransferase/glycerol dehydratase family glycyl radical enzyme, partial [Dehalococcoidia bacterium]